MTGGEVQFRRAEPGDIDDLLRLQAGYYQEEGYAYDERKAYQAGQTFLRDTRLGSAWAADSAAGLVGYIVVTLGYSLEYLGTDAFVDELYLVPEVHGQGFGREALRIAEAACAGFGVKALHLEVEPSKAGARELYRGLGFVGSQRVLMTKRLGPLTEQPPSMVEKAVEKTSHVARASSDCGLLQGSRSAAGFPNREGLVALARISFRDQLIGHDQISTRARQHAGRFTCSAAHDFCKRRMDVDEIYE